MTTFAIAFLSQGHVKAMGVSSLYPILERQVEQMRCPHGMNTGVMCKQVSFYIYQQTHLPSRLSRSTVDKSKDLYFPCPSLSVFDSGSLLRAFEVPVKPWIPILEWPDLFQSRSPVFAVYIKAQP